MNVGDIIDTGTRRTLERIRDGERHLSVHFAASGAGAGTQGLVWAVPGCSKILSGGGFPYRQHETDEHTLGFSPGQYAAESTAVDLAIAAFLRAVPREGSVEPIGVGLAASVASTEVHRGSHRVHAAVITDAGCQLTSLNLVKGMGDEARARDGRTADLIALHALFYALGDASCLGVDDAAFVFDSGHDFINLTMPADDLALERLLANPLVLSDCRRRPVSDIVSTRTMLHAGTFFPPHPGHVEGALASLDAHHLNGSLTTRLIHALTLDPPNKPRVTVAGALRRARALGRMGRDLLVSSGDPLFVDKAERYPGASLAVGADTAIRLLDPRWGVAPGEVLARFERAGTRLYVVGREVTLDGRTEFVTLEHPWLKTLIPADYAFMFKHVPGRWDVSSTQLRAAA